VHTQRNRLIDKQAVFVPACTPFNGAVRTVGLAYPSVILPHATWQMFEIELFFVQTEAFYLDFLSKREKTNVFAESTPF
jgi:hypothetical protein